MSVPVEALAGLHLLRDLPAEVVAQIAPRMTARWYARREIVFNKGEVGDSMGFLLEGCLQATDFTVDGREVGLNFVHPKDFFGELAVIDNAPRDSYVIALTRSQVAFLPRHAARELWVSYPHVAEHLLRRLAARIRQAAYQRTLLSLPQPAQRVCAQLVQLLQSADGQAGRPMHLPTHQELAIMINLSRETVTRVFQALQAQGIVRRDGSTLIVERPDTLLRLAEGKVGLGK